MSEHYKRIANSKVFNTSDVVITINFTIEVVGDLPEDEEDLFEALKENIKFHNDKKLTNLLLLYCDTLYDNDGKLFGEDLIQVERYDESPSHNIFFFSIEDIDRERYGKVYELYRQIRIIVDAQEYIRIKYSDYFYPNVDVFICYIDPDNESNVNEEETSLDEVITLLCGDEPFPF